MKPAQTSRIITPPTSWSVLPWGEYYREALHHHLEPWWPKLFGFHLLKLGHLSAELATDKCVIQHHICLAPEGDDIQVYADAHRLPFLSKSIDACLLAHTLSYSSDPHRILREVDRIIIDDGWLILTNFNSLSLLGLGSCIPGLNRKHPYCSQMFSLMRLIDWLQLLNYEIIVQSRFQVLPWIRPKSRVLTIHLPGLGCLSLIIARKRTFPMTPTPISLHRTKLSLGHVVGVAKSSYRS